MASAPASPEKILTSSLTEKELLAKGQELQKEVKIESVGSIVPNDSSICKVYKRRWLILILFVCYSMSNAFQWIQFAIINKLMVEYYGVSEEWIDNTSLIYCFVYIPLIFPATYLLESKGLRVAVLLGSFGTAAGTWIKVLSASPTLFWVAFTGQTVVAISQIFILGIPPLLAAVWFGSDQVSTATSIGVFGNQLGIALGFYLPSQLVQNGTVEEVTAGLSRMHYGTASVTSAIFILAIFFFKDKPPTPPSFAQAALASCEENYVVSMKRLLSNKGYLLLLLSYGLNVGVFYAISTLLYSFIIKYFPGADEDVGRIGLSIVLSGMVGSVISGLILDKTRRYKETTLVIYFLSLVGMLAYTFTLPWGNHISLIYVVMAALGFFMTGYLPVGFEFGAEITYPESEGTSAGLLNCSVQIFGLVMTPITRAILNSSIGDIGANLTLCGFLAVGLLMTALIKPDLKRLAAQKSGLSPA
ncbi:unnamed protein product [Allacma fusca]|uniref:Choline/ethanolamine transporter FLVCR1 n=1 Tax=Allacma fusca TaxID=39272 RepID=A0A8J2KPB0_9HEXA|nr:unnamed protein product [Allacma fusca]